MLNNENFKKKKYSEALTESFYEIDEMLLKPESKKELKQMRNKPNDKPNTLARESDDANFETQAGCTANVVLIVENEVFIANAGDSRAVIGEDKSFKEFQSMI